jgi:small subunit ribosomal protein S20
MNKKQRNRKLVTQNKRNRMINRRYTSTIKTLSKLFLTKVKTEKTIEESEKGNFKLETKNLVNKVYSIIDKAVKKVVVHKNTAARKKSRIGKLFRKNAS